MTTVVMMMIFKTPEYIFSQVLKITVSLYVHCYIESIKQKNSVVYVTTINNNKEIRESNNTKAGQKVGFLLVGELVLKIMLLCSCSCYYNVQSITTVWPACLRVNK